MNIDAEELIKQCMEEIINGGEYAKISVVLKSVNGDKDLLEAVPLVSVEEKESTPFTMALVLLSMEKTIRDIIAEDEDVRLAFNLCKKHIDNIQKVEINRKDKENE